MADLGACCIPAADILVGADSDNLVGGEEAVAEVEALPDGATETFAVLERSIPAAAAAAAVATPLHCCGQHEAERGMAVADIAAEVGTLPVAADLVGRRHCNAGALPSVPSRPMPLFRPDSSEHPDQCAVPVLVHRS